MICKVIEMRFQPKSKKKQIVLNKLFHIYDIFIQTYDWFYGNGIKFIF